MELLPAALGYEVMREGRPSSEDVPVAWDLEGLAGQTSGEAKVTGVFLDGDGEPMASAGPLVQRVEWYEPGRLVVTDAGWTGDQAVTAALFLDELPEDVSENSIRGETSPDGRSWTAFSEEDFEVTGDEEEGYTAIFYLYDDNEPRYFRLVVRDHEMVLRRLPPPRGGREHGRPGRQPRRQREPRPAPARAGAQPRADA